MLEKSESLGLQAFCRAYGADSPESAMRAACAALLSSVGLEEPPIPLKPLLQTLEISVQRVPRRDLLQKKQPEALLAVKKGGLVVYLYNDPKQHWRRARFSLAHEIGHALLFHALGDPVLIASLEATSEDHKQVERLCDLAASEILMPARAVRRVLRECDFTPDGLALLYDRFLVSREVLMRRVATIMPHTSVVRWKVFSRSKSEPREMRVVGSFPGYSRVRTRPWLPIGCTTRHLDPPIVNWAAARSEAVLESDLRIVLGRHSHECVGMATFFPSRRSEIQQPSFEGFKIPDECERTREIFLFAADKIMAGEAYAWEFKKV